MTLEIPTELEAQLERAARERGTDARTLLLDAARRLVESNSDEREQRNAKRRRLALELCGSVSGGNPTVDDFLRERSEEARQEMLRDEQSISQSRAGLNT